MVPTQSRLYSIIHYAVGASAERRQFVPGCCMRALHIGLLLSLVSLALVNAGAAQDQDKLGKRYGLDVNPGFYPQKTPQEALLSIAKAIESRRLDYLLAHLADPRFVDDTV